MLTLTLLVAVTLTVTLATHSLLVGGAAVRGDAQNLPAKTSSETNKLPSVPYNRFQKCKLKPNPSPRDLIAHRLCIKRILEKEGGTGEGGRWGRSVDDKFRRQMAKFDDILASGKELLPQSIEALCTGDLSHYEHEVREYIQWRCENGYGQMMRRWGRSSAPASTTPVSASLEYENEVLKENNKGLDYFGGDGDGGSVKRLFYKRLTKRDEADDMRAMVEAYREWRSQNGYSQTSGRWG